jgi:hypothetical protein
MRHAFGLILEGFPSVPFRLPRQGAGAHALAWRGTTGRVSGDEFWMDDLGDTISVGWGSFASYRIEVSKAGGEVVVVSEVSPVEAAVAFIFSVLPLVLPLWSIEPFHGSAVLTRAGALVVLGPSGAGKSSIAAALNRRGLPLLADDTCAFDDRMRLWPGAAAINPRWGDAVQAPIGEYNAKAIRAPRPFAEGPAEPAAVVVLEPDQGRTLQVDEPDGQARLRGILANSRHGTFLLHRRRTLQFEVATHLARLPQWRVLVDPARHGPEVVLGHLADRLAAGMAPELGDWESGWKTR